MHTSEFTSGAGNAGVEVSRVGLTQWQAVDHDLVVGYGDLVTRVDGRLFVSIDAWGRAAVFERIAAAMLGSLGRPLHTVVDEYDGELLSCWESAGFAVHRREWEYLVATDPAVTGLADVRPPADITIVPAGCAVEAPLRVVDRIIRDEVEAGAGWHTMPVENLRGRDGDTIVDVSKYVAAAQSDRYVGLLRIVEAARLPRLGLIAVRGDQQRRGIARAMLAHTLGALHARGKQFASAEITESNTAATALFESLGARRTRSNLELVLR
ncbi:GNAT family N-acetyltransferase [Nocardia yunnanensis]|uniref:GNAT family N-acetyltransferase n=1 Tax=Nocardia yunnanensis TaxID=2382165 RepID=A0A386ZB65_9NOCA|nr:GNAT family N-acetyltransferase [Nocardia yunnanensis]AYF73739.1 GNAT family N-acetyltransferase [Nocardia yunnanensis]